MERTDRIGRIGEMMFATEAIARGLTVLQPSGVYGYDWVVEYMGKFTKVQVKTTSVVDSGRRYRWMLNTKSVDADVYAFYVTDTNMFFFIDSSDLTDIGESLKVPINKMQEYNLNNWDIFKSETK